MEFASIEETRIYYTRYAKNTGFSFRMGRVTKSRTNGMIIGREFLCSKEGFRAKKYVKEESNSIIVHNETMVGCKEMLYLKKNGEIWIVSRFVREHNHELFSPKSSQFLFGYALLWDETIESFFLVAKYLVRSNEWNFS